MTKSKTKTPTRPVLRAGLVLLLAASLSACGGSDGETPAFMQVDANGVSTMQPAALGTTLAAYPLETISAAEAQSLAFMREEEQLAHDVYASNAIRWPVLPIFGNIATSEATHSAAIKTLLDRYQLPDPLAGLPNGSFSSATFQALYAALVAASDPSLVDALKVGVQIEELDIRDLEAQKAGIDNADILLVYDNLLRGSRNHLRSYMQTLLQQGGSYMPQYISQATFDAIVNTPIETGR